ncbi:MAG: hypothetical protein GX094_06610 [Clostridiales bacterium]|jgi:hypothetical protein|nr:hypothetical protein [Clostridiales bacterium]
MENKYMRNRINSMLKQASWILRVTQHKDKPVPVLVIKERVWIDNENSKTKNHLKDRGLIYGQSLRRCIPIIQTIIREVRDREGVPLELHTFLNGERITFRGNLPLDEEAGVKLCLLFKLQERVQDMDRVELMAWRIQRFSREEAAYWLSRITQYGEAENRWAKAGMRLMLGGQPQSKDIGQMLERLRR